MVHVLGRCDVVRICVLRRPHLFIYTAQQKPKPIKSILTRSIVVLRSKF